MKTQLKIFITIIFFFIITLYSNFLLAQQTIEIDTFMFKPGYYDDLEEALKKPKNVLYLDIGMQKHTSLPAGIGNFSNIIRLDISFNKFTVLPAAIGKLTTLEYLNLSGCYNMIQVPNELKNLKKLKELLLKDMLVRQHKLVERIKTLLPHPKTTTGIRQIEKY